MHSSPEVSKRLPILVGPILTHGIVDTGADPSLVWAHLVQRLGIDAVDPTNVALKLAGGDRIIPEGEVQLDICLPGTSPSHQWKFIVMNVSRYDHVLGLDWLEQHDAVVSIQSQSIQLRIHNKVEEFALGRLEQSLGESRAWARASATSWSANRS